MPKSHKSRLHTKTIYMEQFNQPGSTSTKVNLVDRVKNIIVKPDAEWNKIAMEYPSPAQIIGGYVVILAGAAALAAFIGYALIGFNLFGVNVKGFDWGLYQALVIFIGGIFSVYITALVVDLLAPTFNSEKNFNRSLQLVAYSFTPAWIGGLLNIIPAISFLGSLFGLYGFYLMYVGLPKIKKTTADKQISYLIVSIIVTILVYIVIGWILNTILLRIFGLSYGTWRL